MNKIKVKTPAKINLVLEIKGKRPDGFHELKSIMQAVSLYDYLTIAVEDSQKNVINISGNNPLIPYNQDNIAYKAAELFLQKTNITNQKININIEKNIPVAAGLAGGSSNAAGTLWGLNKLFGEPLANNELHSLASELGSDLNFCLQGGTCIAKSRGEVLENIQTPKLNIVIAKPQKFGISAKEAYTKYAGLKQKPKQINFEQMKEAVIKNDSDLIAKLLNNYLEAGILPDYPQVSSLKNKLLNCGCINVLMSGSGPCVFGIYDKKLNLSSLSDDIDVFDVKSIDFGVTEVN